MFNYFVPWRYSHFMQLVYYHREMLYLHDFTYLKAKLKYIYYNNNNNNNLYKTIAVLMTDFLS